MATLVCGAIFEYDKLNLDGRSMIVFYLILFLVVCYKASCSRTGYYEDYLDKQQCNSIRGIFILLVFLSHIVPYIKRSGYEFNTLDNIGNFLNGHIGQLMVVMFLFYSGYGVMEQIKKRGYDYVCSMPRKRITATLLNFDIAVIAFVLVDYLLGINLSFKQIMLSLVCWDSVGNSNWYILIILLTYLISYIVFKAAFSVAKANISYKKAAHVISLIVIITSLGLSLVRDNYWYNTMWAFALGAEISAYKAEIKDSRGGESVFNLSRRHIPVFEIMCDERV